MKYGDSFSLRAIVILSLAFGTITNTHPNLCIKVHVYYTWVLFSGVGVWDSCDSSGMEGERRGTSSGEDSACIVTATRNIQTAFVVIVSLTDYCKVIKTSAPNTTSPDMGSLRVSVIPSPGCIRSTEVPH